MNSTFKLENPDKFVACITFRATLEEWRQLRDQLSEKWPSWDLSRQIGELISKAEQQFYATEKE